MVWTSKSLKKIRGLTEMYEANILTLHCFELLIQTCLERTKST